MSPGIVLMSAFRGKKVADQSCYIVWAVSVHPHRHRFATPRRVLQG